MSAGTEVVQQPWWREPTREQWIAFGAAWIGWILDAFDFTIFLLVMPSISKEFHQTATATSAVITATLLLRLAGGFLAGAAADRWGRKLPLMISIVWFALCDGAVALAPSFMWVVVLRTIFGLGMGAEWTAGATLAMENWPQRSRGIASGILQGSWAIGYLLASVISAPVLAHWGWRALFVVAALPALLALPIRSLVPESPNWQKERAERPKSSLGELLAPGLPGLVAWASGVMALGFAGYYGLTSLYPTLLQKELGWTAATQWPIVVCFNLGMLIGATVCGAVAARKGPLVAIATWAVVMIAVLPLYVGQVPGSMALGAGAFLGGFFGGGYAGVTPLLLTLIFPAHVRARCVGLVYHLGAIAAALAPPLVSALHDYRGLTFAQSIMAVTGGANLLLAFALLASRSMRAQTHPDAEGSASAAALH